MRSGEDLNCDLVSLLRLSSEWGWLFRFACMKLVLSSSFCLLLLSLGMVSNAGRALDSLGAPARTGVRDSAKKQAGS